MIIELYSMEKLTPWLISSGASALRLDSKLIAVGERTETVPGAANQRVTTL